MLPRPTCMVNRPLVRLGEYDYKQFGNQSALQNDGTTVLTDKSWVSQMKVGVDYKFTAGPGPRQILTDQDRLCATGGR